MRCEVLRIGSATFNDGFTRRKSEFRIIRQNRMRRNLKRDRSVSALKWSTPCVAQRSTEQAA